ncbi:type II secretion system F family protein [Polynucleobacter kasalickyi]|uniref:Tight adherence protein C n=1 Tax=Polynucleobacter kasalickyi TaxID=1938817 RepID=A0A1W1Y3Z4_9BURK|nr:type II secretion system F family protein [Polynucleobacter kasalickyi]SMC30910.1 tight adherence protein C [Polynucleobacter kasalickyi]
MKNALILIIIWLTITGIAFVVIKRLLIPNFDNRLDSFKKIRVERLSNNTILSGESFTGILNLLGKFSMPVDAWQSSKIKIRLLNAGLHGEKSILIYYASKTFFTLIIPAASFIYSYKQGHTISNAFLLATALAIVGYIIPDLMLNYKIRKRQTALINSFPDALDLVRICVDTGLGLDAAISRVGDEVRIVSPILAEEFEQLSIELRAGSSRDNALTNLAIRTGIKDIEALVAMLKQANRFGTNVTESLHVFAEDLRAKRKVRSQELAAKIPVKISIPIILCIFPALFVVIIGPAIISLFNTLQNTGNPLGK